MGATAFMRFRAVFVTLAWLGTTCFGGDIAEPRSKVKHKGHGHAALIGKTKMPTSPLLGSAASGAKAEKNTAAGQLERKAKKFEKRETKEIKNKNKRKMRKMKKLLRRIAKNMQKKREGKGRGEHFLHSSCSDSTDKNTWIKAHEIQKVASFTLHEW